MAGQGRSRQLGQGLRKLAIPRAAIIGLFTILLVLSPMEALICWIARAVGGPRIAAQGRMYAVCTLSVRPAQLISAVELATFPRHHHGQISGDLYDQYQNRHHRRIGHL